MTMSLQDRITRLAKIHAPAGVVSAYLNTHWADEHQRERTRIFVREEAGRVRPGRDPALPPLTGGAP
jgi:hypothetical protein